MMSQVQRRQHGRKRLFIYPFALALAVLPLIAQNKTFTSSIRLVVIDAQVIDDRTGQAITGLKKEDFYITDEDRAVSLSLFEYRGVPLDIVLLIDTSGGLVRGMSLDMDKGLVRLQDELERVDRMAVFSFSDKTIEKTGFTNNPNRIREAMNSALRDRRDASHNAYIYDALVKASKTLPRRDEDGELRRNCIIVITHNREKQESGKRAIATKTLLQANASVVGLVIDQIKAKPGRKFGVGIPGVSRWPRQQTGPTVQRIPEEQTIDQIAVETGGSMLHYENKQERIWEEAFATLRDRYVLGYSANEKEERNAFHRLRVTLTTEAAQKHPHVSIRARSGYYNE